MDKTPAFPTRFSLIRYFLRGSKHLFAFSVAFAMLASFFDLLSPYIVGQAVDQIVGGYHAAFISAGLVLLAAAAGAWFRYLYRLVNAMGAEKLVERMRNCLFEQIGRLKFSWYRENQTGDIIQRCTSDVETVKSFLAEQLTSVFRIVLMIALAIGFMLRIDRRLTLVSACFVPVIFFYSLFFHGKIGRAFTTADEEEGKLSSIAQENLTGVRVIRAFGRERWEDSRFERQNDRYTASYMKLAVLISAFWSMGDFFAGLQVMLIVVLGAMSAVKGQLSAGEYIAFISYNAMLSWPVRSLGRVISDMSKAGVSVDRIRYIMNAEQEQDRPGALEAPMDRDISFEQVSFRYAREQEEALDKVSFRIPRGKTFGILGGTGSGKSTLMYLLDRLYELEEDQGCIRIGETDIRDIRLDWLRKHIGLVLQEPYLFSRTLGENIGIAAKQPTREQIDRAAAAAELTETVRRFRKGYQTMVGERGVTLSGGQRQRTAIAQMLIRQTPIMIFDDSLSAVDAETDARIRSELRRFQGMGTVILISHRITTLMEADQILVLGHGRVAQRGTHQQLVSQPGFYRRVCEIQNVAVPKLDPDSQESAGGGEDHE